ncbi:MAG: phosphoglycerate dehydrogenase [Chloroflexi bacterium]|nr:phosphoglycerate dehydrogenase [Chloroflexota bacterium]
MSLRVLVTSLAIDPEDGETLKPLRDLGAEFLFRPFSGTRQPGEMAALLAGVDAVIASSDRISAADLSDAQRLRIIARTGVGYDAIDVAAAHALGVAVTITPGTNDHSVADYTLALMLALTRRVVENHLSVTSGHWQRSPGRDLHGKTVGVVGLGRIGKRVVRRLYGFECRILGYDVVVDVDHAKQYEVEVVDLDRLFSEADIITLHVSLTPQTHHLVGVEHLQDGRAKRGVLIVNTCRGSVIDETALIAALHSGLVGGAALDVFETEPLAESPLRDMPNVLLSPHMAGVSEESTRAMAVTAVQEVARVLDGQPPLYSVTS